MLPYPGLLGSLIVTDMRLPLKPEFMAKLGTSHGRLSLLVSLVILHHVWKKGATLTLPNADQFSQFFHRKT